MTFPRKQLRAPSSNLIPPDDSGTEGKLDTLESRVKHLYYETNGFEVTSRRGLTKGLSTMPAADKTLNVENALPPRQKIDLIDSNKITIRKISSQFESESELEQRTKMDSLISIMVSTIMCLSAKYPIPRTNIQATKLFLSTIVNNRGETPTNIKGLLTLLKAYNGPYEGDASKVVAEETPKTVEQIKKEVPEVSKVTAKPQGNNTKNGKEGSEMTKSIRDPSIIPKPIKGAGEIARIAKDAFEAHKTSDKGAVETTKTSRDAVELPKNASQRMNRANSFVNTRPTNRVKSVSPVKHTEQRNMRNL